MAKYSEVQDEETRASADPKLTPGMPWTSQAWPDCSAQDNVKAFLLKVFLSSNTVVASSNSTASLGAHEAHCGPLHGCSALPVLNRLACKRHAWGMQHSRLYRTHAQPTRCGLSSTSDRQTCCLSRAGCWPSGGQLRGWGRSKG